MPRTKDISSNLREAILAAHQFGMDHSCTVRKIFHQWKTLKTQANLCRSEHLAQPKFKACCVQELMEKTNQKQVLQLRLHTSVSMVNVNFITVQCGKRMN